MTAPAGGNAPRIFISYRREDSGGNVGRISDWLAQRFGERQVFRDLDSIRAGDLFAQKIAAEVESCDALLAVIGNRWLTIADEGGARRLDDPDDFVRIEIEAALSRDVRVIPVLVNGAQTPRRSDLPASLQGLVARQAHELSETRFRYDMSQLIETLASGTVGAERGVGRAAASKVSAWAEPRTAEGRWLAAHNGSDEPMYSCTLWLITTRMPPRAAGGLPPTHWRSAFTRMIRPKQDFRHLVRLKNLQGAGLPTVPPVEIIFRDGQRQWWWRDEAGVLKELTPEQGKNYSR